MNPIRQLLDAGDTGASKQDVWDNAVDTAIRTAKRELVTYMDELLDADRTGSMYCARSKPVFDPFLTSCSTSESHGNCRKLEFACSFPIVEEADLVNKGVCALDLDADGYYWKVQEPLVLEAALESLQKKHLDSVFATCLTSMDSLLTMLGPTTTTKGNILELMVRQALLYFNGVLVSELPFLGVAKAALPSWTTQHKIAVTSTGTAQQLKFTNDAEFLSKRTPGLQLCPEPTTRPDSLLCVTITYLHRSLYFRFLSQSYGASLAIKFYTSTLSNEVQKSNESSSDIRKCFLQVSGDVNPTVQKYRTSFEDSMKTMPISIIIVHI